MEREIKFRALKDDMSNCNFVYGQLVYDAVITPRITQVDNSGQGLTFHTCIKNTEGQFTGLKDKNGKEIYEGDIVKYKFCGIYITAKIVFNQNVCSFQLSYKNINNHWITNTIYTSDDIEVIGNIYENPELLK